MVKADIVFLVKRESEKEIWHNIDYTKMGYLILLRLYTYINYALNDAKLSMVF